MVEEDADWRKIFSAERVNQRACAFCEIIQGRRRAHIVFEDEYSMAFLDSKPLFPGHTLIVPTRHYETLADLPREEIPRLFANVKLLAEAVEAAMSSDGSFVAINNRVSQSVPHLHVHVVPRKHGDGLKGFFWPRTKYPSEEEAERVATMIRAKIQELRKN
ncbi:MAG: HIT family protein [Thermoprotei archaeon]